MVPTAHAHFHFHRVPQVVPTSFHPQRGASSVVNQYSVTERQVEYANALPAINIGGAFYNDFIGVIFNYDFYPVKLVMKEVRACWGLLWVRCTAPRLR